MPLGYIHTAYFPCSVQDVAYKMFLKPHQKTISVLYHRWSVILSHYLDCQRYQLHPGDQIHRKLFPNEHMMDHHRYGMHRGFHPYPPPPYGSVGAMYMPENYHHHHGRLHSQGKKVFPKPVYSYRYVSFSLNDWKWEFKHKVASSDYTLFLQLLWRRRMDSLVEFNEIFLKIIMHNFSA